ncbi:MAG: transposase [Gammaproteobacteria bacterium]|nr:transposase [Gammaproteobacteria bacterium]
MILRTRMRIRALLAAPERLPEIRERLGSLSWFMRCLNESIARMANAEDECTGRFWEGRFQCQALLDDDAVLACMAYVDLNPIRAGMCETLEDSDFTSIQRRLRELETDDLDANLEPLAGEHQDRGPPIRLGAYIDLVRFTGRLARERIADLIPLHTHPAFETIRGSPEWWQRSALSIETVFGSAVGSADALRDHAKATGRRWLRSAG